ncbi:MAG: electron transport complex subunit RsxG [Thioalkalispiraceae bacterium]|jgi:electron transport complex protein RnfG
MTSISKNMLVNAVFLGLFAIAGTAIVAFTHDHTKHRIVENKRQHKLEKLHELIPPQLLDNDLDTDVIKVNDPLLARDRDVTIYRARKDNKPVAAIIECVAPDGYSGKIQLLVAVNVDGTLAGVRATEHLETPGLGDAIETKKSNWIYGFDGKSLKNPQPENWKVSRDGGKFDQITSATITSRAVVKATRNVLKYFESNQKTIFK